MFTDKSKKYNLDYTPDLNVPATLPAYISMVLKRDPWLWVFFFVTDFIHAIRYPVAFFYVGLVVDILTTMPEGAAIPQSAWNYTGLIFIILFFGEMAHAIPCYITFDWWKRARAHLRTDLMAYTLGHSYSYFQDNFAGALARKVSEGINKGLQLTEQVRWNVFMPLTVMGTSSMVLFSVSFTYGLIITSSLVLFIFPVFLKLRKIRQKSRIFADCASDVAGQVVDTLTNISAVKSYAREDSEMEEHRRVTEAEMKAWHKMLRVFLLLGNYRRMVLIAFGGGIMYACVWGWSKGMLTAGDMTSIMGISFTFTGAAWHLSGGIINGMESLGYLNDSLKTLVKPHLITDKQNAGALTVPHGEIVFKDVDFEYDNQSVFEKLNITIPARQRIGLIGHSGAGKSTFINLIQRFFDVQGGAVLIDGQSVADVTQKSLREQIAIIPQDTSLFHRSIMENIRYGRLDASDAEVRAAAEKAHATEFIDTLPDGFETFVGERGVKLSGGQRQRISIARAILKDAPILILDEATSALDSESEKQIQDALASLMKGKTVIAVAHRLSTINHLDRLIVIEDGKIIEDGRHKELLAKDGVYKKLWAMQSGGFLKS